MISTVNLLKSRASLPQITAIFFLIVAISVRTFHSNAWDSGLTSNALSLHTVLEFIGILVSFAVFTVGWATYQNVRSTDILVLCVISFAVGWLDLFHTLSFTGMPDFIGPSGPNKAIYFWLASRFTGSLGILWVSLSKPRLLRTSRLRFLLMIAAILWVALWFDLVLLHVDELPVMFIPGQGLTPLKLVLEWTTVAISTIAGFMFLRRGRKGDVVSIQWLGCACFIFALSSYMFTAYREFSDLYNFIGHVFKAIASLFLYRAVFVECVKKPYEEAKRSEHRAVEANLSKSRFLANVSHELRTPLGIISGYSDLLVQRSSLDTEAREWASTISRNSSQLRELIDDLLDLSKAENEKLSIVYSDFVVNAVIADVLRSFDLQAKSKGVELHFRSEIGAQVRVRSDESRLRQILVNIIGNAVKFTPHGSITVMLRSHNAKPRCFEISVHDTGIGLNDSDASKLFQPFAQANDPSKRRFGGTGLGLALSKRLTNLLGGDLYLNGSSEGRGSEFVFWFADQSLETVVTPVAPVSSAPRRDSAPDFSSFRILAAEDSPDNRNLLALYLKPTSAQLTFAFNGLEAVAEATNSVFDLILMDIQMPEMDGFEAVTRLRQDGLRTPILALTAHVHQPERDRAMSGGFNGYLTKPLTKTELWAQMTEQLTPINA